MSSSNIKKVLILSGIKWNDTIQRHQTIATILAQIGFDVYFVEGIVSSSFSIRKLVRYMRHKKTSNIPTTNQEPKNVHIVNGKYVNPNGGIFKIFNQRSNKKALSNIGKMFDIVINYLPVNTTFDFINRIQYSTLIYDCVRDFQNWGGYPNNLGKIEQWLCNKANYIFTDSFYLTNKMKSRWGEKVIQFLPTIDTKLCNFATCKKSGAIKNIGYIGTLGEHIDISLLKELRERDYDIHIFGRVEIPLDFSIVYHGFFSDLEKMFIEIISTVDALIIPYKGNMDGVIPAKTIQCLAVGVPVFISDFYDSRFLKKYFYVYKDCNELFDVLNNFDGEEYLSKLDDIKQFVNANTTAALTNKIKALFDE